MTALANYLADDTNMGVLILIGLGVCYSVLIVAKLIEFALDYFNGERE
jgi:uncharacterized membrane protein